MHTGDRSNAAADEHLLAEFLAGRRTAFDALVQRYASDLFTFVARFVGSGSTADDVVQETFLQVYQSAGGFDPQRRFKPWLFAIAANKARDHLRSRARRRELSVEGTGDDPQPGLAEFLADDSSAPDDVVADDEQREIVRAVIAQMPDHLREILILGYYQRFPYQEIADTLDIPLGTVKSRLHAAVAHFATAFRRRMEERRSE